MSILELKFANVSELWFALWSRLDRAQKKRPLSHIDQVCRNNRQAVQLLEALNFRKDTMKYPEIAIRDAHDRG